MITRGRNDEAAARAEAAVVGSVLRLGEVLDEVSLHITPEDFHDPSLGEIYRACLSVRNDRRQGIDLVTVAEELHRSGQLENVGRHARLAALWENEPTAAHATHYAAIVREHALWRALQAAGDAIAREAASPSTSAEEALQRAEERVYRLAQVGLAGEAVPLSRALDEAAERIDARTATTGAALPTGFGDLDSLTAGLHPGELTVIAARPSVGKTAIALALVLESARRGTGVFLASLEQSRAEIAERLLVAASGVDALDVRLGRLNDRDMTALAAARNDLRGLPVHIDDRAAQTALRVASTARRLRSRHGVGLVVLDYLQLVEPDDPRENREAQVAAVSRRLKQIARELEVPVVALAQLNRAVESRADQRPRLSDLRSSGQIEQDADAVILLHRPATPGLLELILAKQRNGPTGEVTVRFDPARMRFEDYQPTPGGPAWN